MAMARNDRSPLAILGAGPIGIEAALYAVKLNYPVTVYERGAIGDHLWQWRHVRLFSPFAMHCPPLGRSLLAEPQPDLSLPNDMSV